MVINAMASLENIYKSTLHVINIIQNEFSANHNHFVDEIGQYHPVQTTFIYPKGNCLQRSYI